MIDQNDLARDIAGREGLKKSVDIAQIKEVLRITLELLAAEKPSRVLELIESHARGE